MSHRGLFLTKLLNKRQFSPHYCTKKAAQPFPDWAAYQVCIINGNDIDVDPEI